MRLKTYIMFNGTAKLAITAYCEIFAQFQLIHYELYSTEEKGNPGEVKFAELDYRGHKVIILDAPVKLEFELTPSMSLFVELPSLNELESVFSKLAKRGEAILSPRKGEDDSHYAWVVDEFGLSWQLSYSPF